MMQSRIYAVAIMTSQAGDAAFVVGAANETLGNDGFERGGKLQTNLLLLGRREDGDNTLNGFRGVESVQGRENHVAGFGGEQRGGKVGGVDFDFALIDEAALVAVQELDGVFDGDEVVGTVGVDAVDHGGERRGLTGTSGSRNENKSALLFADFAD